MAIKLYDLAAAEDDRRFSPYCWRVKMALKHKGLDFETIPWRFGDGAAIAFAKSKTVPVIVDGSQAVADSWAIAQYLDGAYPSRPGLFGSDEAKTLCDFFAQWALRSLHPAVLRVVILDLYTRLHEGDKPYFRETREKRFGMKLEEIAADTPKNVAALRAALEPVRPVLTQNQFMSGRGPGYADYILFGTFMWARSVSPTRLLEADDPVHAWRERMLDLFGGFARQAKGYDV